MLELLQQVDTTIFQFINQTISNDLFDWIMPWFREKLFWVPLYVFLIFVVAIRFRRHGYIVILSAILTLVIADQLSSHVIKPTAQRTRPCNELVLQDQINVLAPCSGSYSFTSSHAVNHFAVAAFFIALLGESNRRYKWLWLWAFSIAFAQVYVGLHYPFDVFVGGLLGTSIGFLCYKVLLVFYLQKVESFFVRH